MSAADHAATALGPVVVVGGGLAGLYCALKLAPQPVTLVTTAPLAEAMASVHAQGGLAAAVGEGDTAASHASDTVAAGAGLVDEALAVAVARDANERVRDLLALGVIFDRDAEGRLRPALEAAHGAARSVNVAGDRTAKAILQALIGAVRRTPSVRVLDGYIAHDLKLTDGRVTRLVMTRADDPAALYVLGPVSDVVLATGGIGGLYGVTTNPAQALGAGIAMAARAGAAIADAEFVQFHPTALDIGLDPAPLATEVLRGEGAHLVDRTGHRFMPGYHADGELAPRDVVARAVFAEIAAGRGAFLDCRAALGSRLPEAFPTVFAACRRAGLDPVGEVIPVAPAAHFHMGGVRTDANGGTNVAGLWAIGEAASTGLHGANQLGSNALLEALSFAARVANVIRRAQQSGPARIPARLKREKATRLPDEGARLAARALVRATMSANAGLVRDGTGLRTALETLRQIAAEADGDPQILNMVTAARFVVEAALRRKESRGSHVRSDHAATDPRLARRSSITLAGLELRSGLAASDVMSLIGHAGVPIGGRDKD